MKKIRYSKYVPDPASEMSMEDLLNALSDYLLQSGFQNSYGMYDMRDMEQTIEQLKKAIEQYLPYEIVHRPKAGFGHSPMPHY